jgi:DNA-binding transcriptional ArsR family regulator
VYIVNLVAEIGLAKSAISQHLIELKSIGLLKGEVEGKGMWGINIERWSDIHSGLNLCFSTTK